MNDIEKQLWISVFSACYAAYRNQSTQDTAMPITEFQRKSDLARAEIDANLAVKDLKSQGSTIFDEDWRVNEIPF